MIRRETLIKKRQQKGWSQTDAVAELQVKCGIEITASFYGMIERGERNPTLELAFAISRLFGCGIEDIFLPPHTTKRCIETGNIA